MTAAPPLAPKDERATTALERIDVRSDTVTRPTEAMKRAMMAAELGDDVYGDDPTVNALEASIAARVAKQAALFAPSGTQANLLAMMAHCARGEEILIGEDYHVYAYEAGGAATLGGAVYRTLPVEADGALDPARIRAKPDDPHFPPTRLLSLENTHHGRVVPQARIVECCEAARRAGLACHLDGARLMNAAVASETSAAALAEPFDTVSVCFSKGLGAPVGSALCGPAPLIERARRWRKMLGGGMRQAGMLAAAAMFALDHHVERLAEDHARARALADGLSALDGVRVETCATNMVFARARDDEALSARLAAAGVVASPGPRRRLVTHLDIDDAAIARIVDAFALA